MDEIFDRIKSNLRNTKIRHKHLVASLIATEILGIFVFLWILRVPIAQKFFTAPQKAYSVVSLHPQKRYLVSQGDLLTGKAIPNTTVKVLITPGFLKTSVTADSKGDFWYKVPENLQKSIHRITFGNFDKKNKLVTFQTYKFRVQSNISLFNFTDSVKKKVSNLFRSANAQIKTGVIPDIYVKTNLPSPHVPAILTEAERFRFRNYFLPYAYTAAKIVGSDWRLMAMFTYRENEFAHYFDNCLDGNKKFGDDADLNQNTPCSGWTKWGAPNWQVGWAIYPYQWIDKLPEAIAIMRPESSIREIGQEVIDNSRDISRYAESGNARYFPPNDPITYPEVFPDDIMLDQIVEGARAVEGVDKDGEPLQDPKDPYMRHLLGILMKDPAVSSYLLASMWKDLYNDRRVVEAIEHQWGENALQEASDILAGLDNEARGIDLDALITTPQINMPAAVAEPNQFSNPQIEVETVVSQDGSALDESEIANKNLIIERVVIPHGFSEYDLLQSGPGQPNVRGASSTEEVFLDPEQLQNPQNYQVCVQLKSINYTNIVIDSKCKPLEEIIDPQIPTDSAESSEVKIEEPVEQIIESLNDQTGSCPDPDWSNKETDGNFICRGNEACYQAWVARHENSCVPESAGEYCEYDERCVETTSESETNMGNINSETGE